MGKERYVVRASVPHPSRPRGPCPPSTSFLPTLPSSSSPTDDDDHDIPSLLKCNSPAATGKIEQAVGAAVRSSNELPVPVSAEEREERQEGREGGRNS